MKIPNRLLYVGITLDLVFNFQFKELDKLGYQGFAFGLLGDDVELVGTTNALRKINNDDIDYFTLIVRAGELYDISLHN